MVDQTYFKSIDGNFDRRLYAEKASARLIHLFWGQSSAFSLKELAQCTQTFTKKFSDHPS